MTAAPEIDAQTRAELQPQCDVPRVDGASTHIAGWTLLGTQACEDPARWVTWFNINPDRKLLTCTEHKVQIEDYVTRHRQGGLVAVFEELR